MADASTLIEAIDILFCIGIECDVYRDDEEIFKLDN